MSEHQDDRGWWLLNAPTLPWRLWPLIRDRHSTLSDVLQRLFGDDEAVKLALAPNIVYYTDDPDTMPFISFAIPQASYLLGGGHYIRGGSQVLSDRLVAIVREAGGACEASRDASAILLEGDRVCGVRHHARDARRSTGGYCADRVRKCCAERARRYAARSRRAQASAHSTMTDARRFHCGRSRLGSAAVRASLACAAIRRRYCRLG